MLEIHNFEGKTKEEALEKAISKLEIEEKEILVNYNEIEGKLFKSKKVEIIVVTYSDLIMYIKEYFKKISELMEVDIKPEIKIREEAININLITDNNSIIIGKDGKTVNALQLLLKQAINNKIPFIVRVNLDVSDYKSKKVKYLEYEIKKICKEVLKSKVDVQLDPMNSYERRIVHTVVSSFEQLESMSVEKEPNRYIIIKHKE